MNIRAGTGILFAAACLLVSVVAFAAGPRAVREQAEASMLVTGKIQIDTTGKVTHYTLDKKDKLPAGVVRLLDQAVPNWTFEPVLIDGKAMNVSTGMSIRVVAQKASDETYSIGIRSAGFGESSGRPEERPRALSMPPPSYPEDAARSGVAGTVYLLLRAGRDGKVIDAIAEQVNLGVVASENVMDKWRRRLADTSIRQAKRWSFIPPTEGDEAKLDYWVLRVPVVFSLDDPHDLKTAYGRWQSYVPGPRQSNPWENGSGNDAEGTAFSPDVLPPGNAYMAGSGLRLLSAL